MTEFMPYNEETASVQDRIAWVLCQIIDADAPLRWTRYRFAAECIAHNPKLMADIRSLADADTQRPEPVVYTRFVDHIQHVINYWSMENASNTPDWILAQYLEACLYAFNMASQQRETWYGRDPRPADSLDAAERPKPVAWLEQTRFDDGTPKPGGFLVWAGRNAQNDFPVGTKFYTDPPDASAIRREERKLPPRMELREYRADESPGKTYEYNKYVNGWNACLDAIRATGEK